MERTIRARPTTAVIPGLAEGESPEPMNTPVGTRRTFGGFAWIVRKEARSAFMGSGFAFGDPE
jgi:hypothetical protein